MDMAEEIFVHHLTRFAVVKAMDEGHSPIYGAFYAFDEVSHAFGPEDEAALGVLSHVDHTIDRVARARSTRSGESYELLVLSDHGHIETTPFAASHGKPFAEVLAGLLPGFRIEEVEGKAAGPRSGDARGAVTVTKSGGAAHIYFADRGERMTFAELQSLHPGLMRGLAQLREVSLAMARDGEGDVFLCRDEELRGAEVKRVLAPYDEPDILHEQLARLNAFRHAGDIVVFGAFIDGRQVNFENQAGGHGSIGGEQLHPFVLAKREWKIDTSGVNSAQQLHPILCRLRDRLAA
jgi:hypothetical protein